MNASSRTRRINPLFFVLSLLLIALGGLFARAQDAEPTAPAAVDAQRPAAVVVVTLDTTRADRLGSYGWPHARTPNLDALAARGTRFARVDTAVPITMPSHSTLFTGRFPPRHGVRDNALFTLPDDEITLAERFQQAGWTTAAVTAAAVVDRRYGLAQGFDVYDDDLSGANTSAPPGTAFVERTADAVTDAALAALDGLEPPFFLWVHYFDPHHPYEPPAGFRDLGGPTPDYDGELAFVDAQLKRLLDALPANTLIAAIADHGEMLGEHGEPTHGLLLRSGARRVPWLLAGPGVPVGRTVDTLVRTADLAPTLAGLAGLPAASAAPASERDGRDLHRLLAGGGEPGETPLSYTESFLPYYAHGWYPPRALSDGATLYVHGPKPRFYDLQTGAAASAQNADAWAKRLRDFLAARGETLDEGAAPAARSIAPEEAAKLRALGYLGADGGAGGARDGGIQLGLPDVHDGLALASALHTAGEQVRTGRCDDAVAPLRQLVRAHPTSYPALNLLGLCLQQQGRLASALGAFRRAAQLQPSAIVPLVNAANCLIGLERFGEAIDTLRLVVERDPGAAESAANLAALLRAQGDRAGARRTIDAALSASNAANAHPGLLLERGNLRAQDGDLAGALDDFRAAAQRDPANPAPLANAVQAALALGRNADAAVLLVQQIALEPERPDLWGRLGQLYRDRLGDPAQALRCFRRARALERDPGRQAALDDAIRALGGR
ncbi:MAG: sulfatase-like hydrolase/transferase [Acidobacteriota bacterium]